MGEVDRMPAERIAELRGTRELDEKRDVERDTNGDVDARRGSGARTAESARP
jgi:hypothetical protein